MSGENDRASSKPAANIFCDDAGAYRPPPRARRPKPPPGIISAGGVDMARAHASGIKIREARAPAIAPDEPRVVITPPPDTRRAPTPRSLIEGRRADDDARPALLPATLGETTAIVVRPRPDRTPSAPPPRRVPLPMWARAAVAAALLVAGAGASHQLRALGGRVYVAPRAAALMNAAPHPILPPPPPIAAEDRAAPPPVEPVTEAAVPAPPPRRAARPSAARPRPAPAAKDAGFRPPFELPAEKKHD